MNQTTTDEKFFPTAMQRKTLAETDAELVAIIRRRADADGFVKSDILDWGRTLPAWPEVGTDQKAWEQFVRERVENFLRLGLLRRAEKMIDGHRVRGFTVTGRKNPSRDRCTVFGLTPKDRQFLRQLKVSW